MPYPKIATCCYCGARAALVLKGEARHELSCSSCGAPLHDLKALKASHEAKQPAYPRGRREKSGKFKGKKKRKTLSRRILSEAIDILDDIFD